MLVVYHWDSYSKGWDLRLTWTCLLLLVTTIVTVYCFTTSDPHVTEYLNSSNMPFCISLHQYATDLFASTIRYFHHWRLKPWFSQEINMSFLSSWQDPLRCGTAKLLEMGILESCVLRLPEGVSRVCESVSFVSARLSLWWILAVLSRKTAVRDFS